VKLVCNDTVFFNISNALAYYYVIITIGLMSLIDKLISAAT